MEKQNNQVDAQEEIKVEKVSIEEVKKNKEDEIVDNIMSKILKIK